ncbi:hypothetical protein H9P43_000706 [Blastocladiella emersonii ATCC 22665]|nr:hypothetical protein H9P43_000706 [Blastocladiella emersonii ATCC 22665]
MNANDSPQRGQQPRAKWVKDPDALPLRSSPPASGEPELRPMAAEPAAPKPIGSTTSNTSASSQQPRYQPQPQWTSPFAFRLPRLTPAQVALINRYSGYGWTGLIVACGIGVAMGYESKVLTGNKLGKEDEPMAKSGTA